MRVRASRYFFKARIVRKDGHGYVREGFIRGLSSGDVLKELCTKAVEDWECPMRKVELFLLDGDGTMTPAGTPTERINCVVQTNQRLNTGKFKNFKLREEPKALPAPEKEPAKQHPLVLSNHQWPASVGNLYVKPVFGRLKEYVT